MDQRTGSKLKGRSSSQGRGLAGVFVRLCFGIGNKDITGGCIDVIHETKML